MIDDALVLRVERLRDEVEQARTTLRQRYKTLNRPVAATDIRDLFAQLGERWLVEIAPRDDVRQAVGENIVGELSIEFQRLITYSEQLSQRSRYETSVKNILREFRNRIAVPLKQARNKGTVPSTTVAAVALQSLSPTSVFVAQSFLSKDTIINSAVERTVEAWGFTVVTGEKPRADTVSKKVRDRIEMANLFLGIFTRRDRLKARTEWTTSSWVIDEKAYALAKGKKLILLKETGVQSIGGIQGDYDYIEFAREDMVDLLVKLLQVLRALGRIST